MKKFSKKYKKKEVIFFCPSIEEGGVEKNLINIANGLTKEFKIFVITANKNKKKLFSKNINFISPKSNYYNNKSRILKSLICSYFLFRYCKSNFLVFSFQSNLIAILTSKLLHAKVIMRSNSSPNYYASSFFKRKLIKFIFNFADKIVVNSIEFKKEFKKFFSITPTVIYNLIEPKKLILKKYNKQANFKFFDRSNDYLKILSVGRLVDQKNHITILKAINLIKKKRKIKLCIIGKGILYGRLKKFIDENNLRNHVKLIGYKKNVYPYFKKSDLFILSSLYEGLPNSLIEALTLGLNIISSDCKTGPKEILNKGKYGKLFKVGDYKTLSNIILNSKKRNSKKFVIDNRFDFKNNLEKYKNIITKV